MQDLGAKLIKESTKTHFRRRLVCCPRKAISNLLLAKGVVQHSQRQMTASSSSRTKAIHQVALDIRVSIRSSKNNMSCTPRQSEHTAMCLQKLAATPENMVLLPENIKPYISTSLASCARLAQLVRSLTANQEVPGLIPGLVEG